MAKWGNVPNSLDWIKATSRNEEGIALHFPSLRFYMINVHSDSCKRVQYCCDTAQEIEPAGFGAGIFNEDGSRAEKVADGHAIIPVA